MENKDLAKLRRRVDEIDDNLIELLIERMDLSTKVGEAKRTTDERGVVVDSAREEELVRRLQDMAQDRLPGVLIRRIWREIISESVRLQRELKVSYLGPPGTFSHTAALLHFGSSSVPVPQENVAACFDAVKQGQSEFAIVPYANSTEGAVGETFDLLRDTTLVANGEMQMRIQQNLLGRTGEKIDGLKTVYSHPQSFAQCRKWINANLHGVALIDCASNGAAAQAAAKAGSGYGAIGGVQAGEMHNLQTLMKDIEDNPHNVTQFLIIGHNEVRPTGEDKTTLVMSLHDKPGALVEMLNIFADNNINMSRLESRPTPDLAIGDFRFFIDVEGHRDVEPLTSALLELEQKAANIKVIGSYPSSDDIY